MFKAILLEPTSQDPQGLFVGTYWDQNLKESSYISVEYKNISEHHIIGIWLVVDLPL
jgi:hypothetical protein